jgi:hypothetical protein
MCFALTSIDRHISVAGVPSKNVCDLRRHFDRCRVGLILHGLTFIAFRRRSISATNFQHSLRRRPVARLVKNRKHGHQPRQSFVLTARGTFMLRLIIILVAALGLGGCKEPDPKDPKQVEFEKKFASEAVLVKTCPGDPRYASGPTAGTQRVYRFEKELWVEEVTGYRRVDGAPETVCDLLLPQKSR